MKITAALFSLALGLILVNFTGQCDASLEVGFYRSTCKDAESIVFSVVQQKFSTTQRIAPALLRLHFHDCFVKGCDASILLEDGASVEKNATPNRSVFGYDVIDEAKKKLEDACEGVVSCADIIAIAARDAVQLTKGVRYEVQTGRLDGTDESLSSNADDNLPSPRLTVPQTANAFANKGLNVTDMVLLLGGHTIGFTHCAFFQDRLYDFNNTGKPDTTMDQSLVEQLRSTCPQSSTSDATVSLDQNLASTFIVDNSFYNQIMLKRGILPIDQALALDPMTSNFVASLAKGTDFATRFGQAMTKLGAVDVITDKPQGEIRQSCRSRNKNKTPSSLPSKPSPFLLGCVIPQFCPAFTQEHKPGTNLQGFEDERTEL